MSEAGAHDLGIEGLEGATEIGVGGFATVYMAQQPAFRRTVAVKVLAALNLDDVARERFERECQAMGSLSEHPNIVTVYGAGFTGSSRPYLVMAYLPGGSLAQRLKASGPLPWQETTLIGVHLAGALETAHRAGIIHRDIKPGNVLMSPYGDAQLTDFGIARISGGHETRSGVVTASMSHAPPEVLDGQRPDRQADVYSLGSTLYELLAGRPAFEAEGDESMVPMLRRILTEPPPDLRPRGVPDAVCRVVEQAMAKEPAERQASAVELGRQLQAARASLGLEGGKLTVPADARVEQAADAGEHISFVAAAPPSPDLTAPAPSSPLPPSEPQPAVSSAVPPPAPPAPPMPGEPASPVPGAPVVPAAAYAPPGPPVPAYAPPAAPPPAPLPSSGGAPAETPAAAGTRRTGLLVGIAAFVVVVLVGAVVAVVLTRSSGEAASGSSTTVSTAPSTTTTTSTAPPPSSTDAPGSSETGYSRIIERQFVRQCTQNGAASEDYCQCVFDELRATVPFDRYLALEERARRGEQLANDPVFKPVIDACKAKIGPGSGGASPLPPTTST
ncbi:MAG: serine/threonine-protein kinase [Acidimicrobiales bacterium]